MNFKLFSLAIGMTLISTGVNAENTILDESLAVRGNVSIGTTVTNKNSALEITVPTEVVDRSGAQKALYDYIIQGFDNQTPAYNLMFQVDRKGKVSATSFHLKQSSVSNTYSANLRCSFENNSWSFNTNSYSGGPVDKYYGVDFNVSSFTINKGDLTVNGKITCKDELNVVALNASSIKAEDINVNMNNAADYVFEDDYNLKSLSEVESYVKSNKHLPGIPSAAEMEQNGVSVSAMSNMLLEKVEELTLHMIRLEKENAALKAKVESLEK